mgnify:CR=1 FL=1
MATEIRVPTLGESVSEATIGTWFKKVGDTVKADEPSMSNKPTTASVALMNCEVSIPSAVETSTYDCQ